MVDTLEELPTFKALFLLDETVFDLMLVTVEDSFTVIPYNFGEERLFRVIAVAFDLKFIEMAVPPAELILFLVMVVAVDFSKAIPCFAGEEILFDEILVAFEPS